MATRAIVGEKVGMTQVWDDENRVVPVTVLRVRPCRVLDYKFIALGLETLPAKHVQAPLVAGCHANVECKLVDTLELDGLYLFIGQAVTSYIDNQIQPVARLAGKTFKLEGPI